MSTTSIALSGVNAALLQLDVSAHNVANQQTPEFKPQAVERTAEPEGGVRTKIVQTRDADSPLEGEIVKQMSASYAFQANLRVLQTEEKMTGALLDARA